MLTVDLISWGQKPDVCEGDSSSISIIKLHHHTTLLLLLTWTLESTTKNTHDVKLHPVYECAETSEQRATERRCQRHAHHAGRIRGKGSESAHSSRHTHGCLSSGWLRSGVGHLTPEESHSAHLFTFSMNRYRTSPEQLPVREEAVFTRETYSFCEKLLQRVDPGPVPSLSLNDNAESSATNGNHGQFCQPN